MELVTVKIEKPDDINFILGQSHFIKTVEDIHEALVQAIPGIKFGLAFCESSGEMLIRWTGTDDAMIDLAKRNALALSAIAPTPALIACHAQAHILRNEDVAVQFFSPGVALEPLSGKAGRIAVFGSESFFRI